MFDKIKQTVIWIVTPLAFIAGYIYYLLTSRTALQHKLDQATSEKDLIKDSVEKEKADEKAKQSTADYQSLRDEYLNRKGGSTDR